MTLFAPAPVSALQFSKTAAVPLDDDPTKWASQILQELYRQVPEASEYAAQVIMLREEPEQGYALGVIVISGQTDSALSATQSDSPQSKKALVPIIVANNELYPLDTLMTADKKMLPLNGGRLREALFRPNTFDMMTDDEGDQSLFSMFYPPGRSANAQGSGMGFGGGAGGDGGVSYMMGPGMKNASAQGLLHAISHTLSQQDLDGLAEKIAELGLTPYLATNAAFGAMVSKMASHDGALLRKGDEDILMDKAARLAPTDVHQFGWDQHRGYWMKSAARSLYAPPGDGINITRGQLIQLAGAKVAAKVDAEGPVTLAESVEGPLSTSTDRWEVVTKAGVYRVKDTSGNELTGWVIPNLVDLDGTRVPMTAFTNGSAAAVQSEVVGSPVSSSAVNLTSAAPKGTGLFYVAGPQGIEATVPVQIVGSEASMDGSDIMHVMSMTGTPARLHFVDGVQAMVPGHDEVVLPKSARFLPMSKEAPVPLMDNVDAMSAKTASSGSYIEVRHGGTGHVSLTLFGLPELAKTAARHQSVDDAVFTLCAAGSSPLRAYSVIKTAELNMSTETMRGLRDVRSVDTVLEGSMKTASLQVGATHKYRRDLVKEAAVLPDIQTVDTVLSLGYINPENIRIYVAKLPYLDRALNTLCELVVFSRLGMSEVPEGAAARAARALDEVIQGLKGLAMRAADSTVSTPR